MKQDSCLCVRFEAKIIKKIPHNFLKEVRQAAKENPGFLGMKGEIQGDLEITYSYWKDQKSVENWSCHPLHLKAKNRSAEFYAWVKVEMKEDLLPIEFSIK